MVVTQELHHLKAIVKSMVPTLITDLIDFISARRACRKHVLINFTISHEPNKLINGPIWGAKLFNASQVSGLFGDAERQNQNLRSRWGVPMKRKYSELFGLLPKNLQLKTQETHLLTRRYVQVHNKR